MFVLALLDTEQKEPIPERVELAKQVLQENSKMELVILGSVDLHFNVEFPTLTEQLKNMSAAANPDKLVNV